MDRIKPGAVPWKKTHAKPRGRIHLVDNCNQVVTVGRTMGLTLVNIGGMDIAGRHARMNFMTVVLFLACSFSCTCVELVLCCSTTFITFHSQSSHLFHYLSTDVVATLRQKQEVDFVGHVAAHAPVHARHAQAAPNLGRCSGH